MSSVGERWDRARRAEQPAWIAEGRWWNSGWFSIVGLVVIWLPLLIVVVFDSDKPAFALLFPGVLILFAANHVRRCLKRKKAGGRF